MVLKKNRGLFFFSKFYIDLIRIFICKYGFRGSRVQTIFDRVSAELVKIRNGSAVAYDLINSTLQQPNLKQKYKRNTCIKVIQSCETQQQNRTVSTIKAD